MESNLDILETKVIEAVSLIKELKVDNLRLSEKCSELEAAIGELEAANGRLTTEIEAARSEAGSLEIYEEKRKEIEDRVGGLLQKLEGLG